jgi:proline dehydrogenase
MEKRGNLEDKGQKYSGEAGKSAGTDAGSPIVDFSNTEVAFANKPDKELKKAAWLFGLMNKHWLVGIGSKLGIAAVKMHLPFIEGIVKNTIFEQFCGGTTLLESRDTIDRLYGSNIMTILDYGAEGKEKEEDFNYTMNETIRSLDFAANHESVYMVSAKITGMARFGLLEAKQHKKNLSSPEQQEYQNVLKRIDSICHVASQKGVAVAFDAEESWIQDSINELINLMMQRYNKDRAVVYNTYQLYRKDQLDYLRKSHQLARKGGYTLAAKLVRGAYMEKERERAEKWGYPDPIHPNKRETDHAYNEAVRYCVENYETLASINASHNAQSNLLQAELIARREIPRDHPHLIFCQLYGMSDNLTFNLAKQRFRAAKYLPYGPVREVVPYLIRRAQENSSVTGDMSREYQLVLQEMKRRGLE